MKRLVLVLLAVCMLAGVIPMFAQGVDLQIPAKSALLMEAATGTVLYERNATEALPPASVTKVMTMLLIMEAVDSGKIGWEDTVTASEAAAAKGGSQIYLKAGETMTVSDMVKAIAVSSANDCACAMAEHLAGSEAAFVQKMNERAQELGMENTQFVNCTGLDDSQEAQNHKTSARDIALMSRELITRHPDIKQYTTIWMDTLRGGTFGLSNTNKMVRFYSGATGLKTGFTAAAGYCLSATAQREDMELIAVVMGCQTSKERFAACKALLDYGFANYSLVMPQAEQEMTVPVKLGKQEQVTAILSQKEPLLIDKAQRGGVTTQVKLEEGVDAPVRKGQRLGTLTVKSQEQVLCQIPLVAEKAVQKLSWFDVFLRLFKGYTMAKA